MQFHDKTAYVWGLRYRWDPSLSMNPVRRFAHFMPPWIYDKEIIALKHQKGRITEIEIVLVFPNICQWMHFTCQRLFTTPITFHSLMEKVAIIFRSITYLDLYFKRQYYPQLDISRDEKEAQHDNFSEFCISSSFGHHACHLLRIFRIQIWLTGST